MPIPPLFMGSIGGNPKGVSHCCAPFALPNWATTQPGAALCELGTGQPTTTGFPVVATVTPLNDRPLAYGVPASCWVQPAVPAEEYSSSTGADCAL